MATDESSVHHCPDPPAPYCPTCVPIKNIKAVYIALSSLMEEVLVESSTLCSVPQLISNGNSPFYNPHGYSVVQTYPDSAQLLSVDSIDSECLGKDARLTVVSETGGIPMRVPFTSIIEIGDLLHLLSIYRSPGNLLFVSSFLYQACKKIHLRVAVALNYLEGQMMYLFEPKALNEGPIKEMMTIDLPSGTFFCFRTMLFREHYSQGEWRSVRMQLTTLSPIVSLTMLEFVADEGVFCQGPANPWNSAKNVVSFLLHAIYWIPCTVYNCISLPVHCQTLCAQVSICPHWAFSTSKYTVRFLMHQLIQYKFAPLKILINTPN